MSSRVEYHRFSRGESCTEEGCRSRKYYIEDGKKFCQKGHEQAGFTQTQQDEDDWKFSGKKSRKQKEGTERVHRLLSGRDATELYLQCYQLILWKQLHWLINAKGFPADLETVVRDLWSLRARDLLKSGNEKDYGSASGTMFSSQSEGEHTDTDAKSVSSRRSRRSIAGEERLPKLIETLGLCYLGAVLLRLPVSLGDLFRWATEEDIIYTRAIKEIPKEMRSKLPPTLAAALEIHAELSGPMLHRKVSELVEYFNTEFEMTFPPLNFPFLIYKHMKELFLPVEVYPGVRRLASLLEFDFTYPHVYRRSNGALAYPECQIIGLIVLVTKLCHPFDAVERTPYSKTDPTIIKIDWLRWREVRDLDRTKGMEKGKEIRTIDSDVLAMSDNNIDDYLDWYQRTWMDDRDPKMPKQILDFFPLQEISAKAIGLPQLETQAESTETCQNIMVPQNAISEKDEKRGIRRPGELYKRDRSSEELTENARAFFETAARNTGMSLKMLVRSVFQLETLLEKWRVAEIKRAISTPVDGEESSDEEGQYK